jgi:hypothetical protein
VCSVLTVLLGIGALAVSEATGLDLPHPPAWIFLGLASYGAARLAAERAGRRQPRTQARDAVPGQPDRANARVTRRA